MKRLVPAGLLSFTVAAAQITGGGSEVIDVTQGLVIQNATVVNTRDGSLKPGMSVVIDGGQIRKIAESSVVRTSGSARVVDATGQYLVPGFLDMHTHAMAAADKPVTHWPLLIAHGITGVREMSGSAATIQRVRKLNADSAAGLVDAPEVLQIAGDLFAGQAPTADLAVAFVQQQKTIGADFVKVVGGPPAAVMAALGEAKNQGLGVAGHLITSVPAANLSAAGWRAMEHLGAGWGFLLDCSTDEAAIRADALAGAARPPFPATFVINPHVYDGAINAPFYQRVMDTYSASKCQNLAQTFVRHDTWQVPTLIRLRTMKFGADPTYRNDPNLRYVDPTTRALWERLAQDFATNVPAGAVATHEAFYGFTQSATRLMKQNGANMLAGSDLGGIWLIPGISLHQEFRELAAAGLSPLEVLQMTTLNGAQFLNREATMGTVDEGKQADLVLLSANPIENASNLSRIAGVFLNGKYFSAPALEAMKNDVALAYSRQKLAALHTAMDSDHKH